MTPTEEELFPCPFCGSDARPNMGSNRTEVFVRYIMCSSCGAMADKKNWNRRQPQERLKPLNEGLIWQKLGYLDGKNWTNERKAKYLCQTFGQPVEVSEEKIKDIVIKSSFYSVLGSQYPMSAAKELNKLAESIASALRGEDDIKVVKFTKDFTDNPGNEDTND